MAPQRPIRESEREKWNFFSAPEVDRTSEMKFNQVKNVQLLQPLFESAAPAPVAETPYVKLLTQLFGDRAVIANATGCSQHLRRNLRPLVREEQGRARTGVDKFPV